MTENKDFKWFVYLPFLSEEQCDDLIKKIKGEDSWVAAGVYDPQKEKSTSVNPSHCRDCDELYLLSKTN